MLRRCATGIQAVKRAAATGTRAHEKRAEEAKHPNDGCKNPGALFHNIVGLLYTHKLVAEPGYVSSKTATLGVLHQDDETQNEASENYQDDKK